MDSTEILGYKENIQPLRNGRDASKLCAGLQAKTDSDVERSLQAQRQEYETLLRDDSIDDPLSVWYEYVYWLEQSFPSHTHKANIHVILRKCINKFKQTASYKNDERFVKLCLKYASMSDNTQEILSQVYGNDIGVTCAILYIAWAEQFVLAGSFKKAAKVYEKGINRLAQPLQLLKDARLKFEAYLVNRIAGEVFQPTGEVYETGPVRQAYNKLRPLSVRENDVVPNVRVGENVAPPGKYKSSAAPQQQPGQKFNIFQDKDEDGLDVQPTAKLHKVKSQSALSKENNKKPGVWTLPENKAVPFSVPPAALPFQVHVDDEAAKEPAVPVSAPLTSALRPRQHDEFNDDFVNTPLFVLEPYDPKVRAMYRKEQVYAGGMELQFEELRAIRYRRRMAQTPKVVPSSERKPAPAPKLASEPETRTKEVLKDTIDAKSDDCRNVPRTKSDPTLSTPAVKTDVLEKQKGLSVRTDPPLTTPMCSNPKQSSTRNDYLDDDMRKTASKTTTAPSSSKHRAAADSGRKSLKVRPGEEARSARRRIAMGGAVEESERRPVPSARKSAQSNFGGVVRRALVLDGNDPAARPEQPSDSFINQTIHTKEAVHEMQELWFAKPASPARPAAPLRPSSLSLTPPPAAAALTPFQFYVDESCLAPSEPDQGAAASRGASCPAFVPCVANDENKENAAPRDYQGGVGRSTRPVTGILTPSDNVPFQPIAEQDEEPDEGSDSMPEMPCNTTGITETWNFTQAFAFPRITQASTPNVRRSLYQPPPTEQPDNISYENPGENSSPEPAQCEIPMDLKVTTAPQAAAVLNPVTSQSSHMPENLSLKDSNSDARRCQPRAVGFEHRTMPDKNLSIIVETSREYKSCSSGSGTSNYCSKLLPFTPGAGESRADINKRFNSYSHAEDTRKTPFAYKTQSTYGYEASGELSCTNTRPACEDGNERSVGRKLSVFMDEPMGEVQLQSAAEVTPSEKNTPVPKTEEIVSAVKRMTIAPDFSFGQLREKSIVMDIDPFDVKVIDSWLEKIEFPSGHQSTGCHFVYSKLPSLKINSKVALGSKTFELKKVLGEGAYAKVFLAQSSGTGFNKVLKYQKPAFPWEFYIAREIRARCSTPDVASLFMQVEEGYFFENASLLMTSPVEYGDLLSAINLYKINQGKPMSDYLALYFTVQILEIIETLHSFNIIHGDVKPDNFLLKKLRGKLCLELIDFGRSIDMTLLPPGTTFTRVVTTDGFTCIEMQTGRPWTYQADLYGVAGCVHCLLYGDYMKVVKKGQNWEITKSIPRYLAKSGWKDLFQALLNIPSCTELPDLTRLRTNIADKLQSYGTQPDLIKLNNFLDYH